MNDFQILHSPSLFVSLILRKNKVSQLGSGKKIRGRMRETERASGRVVTEQLLDTTVGAGFFSVVIVITGSVVVPLSRSPGTAALQLPFFQRRWGNFVAPAPCTDPFLAATAQVVVSSSQLLFLSSFLCLKTSSTFLPLQYSCCPHFFKNLYRSQSSY